MKETEWRVKSGRVGSRRIASLIILNGLYVFERFVLYMYYHASRFNNTFSLRCERNNVSLIKRYSTICALSSVLFHRRGNRELFESGNIC